jgi:FkbM family methyltransferase
MRITGNTTDLIQRYLYWFGVWEPDLTRFILRRMAAVPSRTFIDVGANIGYFSLLVAKAHASAHVVSVEASPPTLAKLRRHIQLNQLRNIRVVPQAASDYQGSIDLFLSAPNNEGATTTLPGIHDSASISVACAPLSCLLTSEEVQAARLIKIDVEGAEASVLRGLEPDLATLPQDVELIVEISAQSRCDTEAIFALLGRHGFHAYELTNSYGPQAYLERRQPDVPRRLLGLPAQQTDVIFSRVDATILLSR